MYVCDDANECICMKNIKRGKYVMHLAKMMVVLKQRLNSAGKE
jgi:hypothetical protein